MKKLLALFLVGLILVFSLTSCAEVPENTENITSSTVEKTEAKISSSENKEENNSASKNENIIDLSKVGYSPMVMFDVNMGADIKDLANKSTYVVLGKAEVSYTMGYSRDFSFVIEEVLKGDIESERITVSNSYLSIENIDDYYYGNALFKNPLYVEAEEGETYLLFLSKKSERGLSFYTPAVEPYMVKIENGMAALVLPEILTKGYNIQKAVTDTNKVVQYTYHLLAYNDTISGMSLDEIKAQIK